MSDRRHEDRASEQGSHSPEPREPTGGTTEKNESKSEDRKDGENSDRQKERASEAEASGRNGQKKEGGKKQKEKDSKGGSGQEKEKQNQDAKENRDDEEGNKPPPKWQWLVAALSTIAVAGLLSFMVYEALSGRRLPPIVSVRVERVLEAPDGYLVEVGVYNRGSKTAAGLTIEGTLKRDTTTVETSTATLSFVPAESEREAGLYFSKDPREYRLEVRPRGYDHP